MTNAEQSHQTTPATAIIFQLLSGLKKLKSETADQMQTCHQKPSAFIEPLYSLSLSSPSASLAHSVSQYSELLLPTPRLNMHTLAHANSRLCIDKVSTLNRFFHFQNKHVPLDFTTELTPRPFTHHLVSEAAGAHEEAAAEVDKKSAYCT